MPVLADFKFTNSFSERGPQPRTEYPNDNDFLVIRKLAAALLEQARKVVTL